MEVSISTIYSAISFYKNNNLSYSLRPYGEKILNHYIDKAADADKLAYVKDLLSMYDERLVHFESQTKVGDMISDKAQLMYKYKTELGLSNEEVYNTFDKAYTTDLKTFKNPKALYTYFSLMVDLFDAGKKTDQELFDKYDDVVDKIETEIKNSSEGLNKLIAKEEAGTVLTKKDKQYKKYYEKSAHFFPKL